MSVAENIKRLREKYSLTQAELGRIAGVTDKAVCAWEQSLTIPRMGAIQKLSDHFGITKSSLIDDQDTKPASNAIRIPVYGTVPAGIPMEAIEDVLDYEEIPREMTAGGRMYFGLIVHGDSMEPVYKDGDTILILQQDHCESGQVAVVIVNGYEAVLKKVLMREGSIVLQSLNPAYEPLIYGLDDQDNPITILGVVVEIRRKVK